MDKEKKQAESDSYCVIIRSGWILSEGEEQGANCCEAFWWYKNDPENNFFIKLQ